MENLFPVFHIYKRTEIKSLQHLSVYSEKKELILPSFYQVKTITVLLKNASLSVLIHSFKAA